MEVQIRVQGLSELDKALHNLPDKVGRKLLRQGVTAAGKVIQDQAELMAPPSHRKGGKRIGTSVSQKWNVVKVSIGLLKKFWYLKWLEVGTSGQEIRKGQKYIDPKTGEWQTATEDRTGKPIVARPFLRPALIQKAGEAIEALKAVIWAGIQEEFSKARSAMKWETVKVRIEAKKEYGIKLMNQIKKFKDEDFPSQPSRRY